MGNLDAIESARAALKNEKYDEALKKATEVINSGKEPTADEYKLFCQVVDGGGFGDSAEASSILENAFGVLERVLRFTQDSTKRVGLMARRAQLNSIRAGLGGSTVDTDLTELTERIYNNALDIANKDLPADSTERLVLINNFSRFMLETLRDKSRAYNFAKDATSSLDLDKLSKETSDRAVVAGRIRDDIAQWQY